MLGMVSWSSIPDVLTIDSECYRAQADHQQTKQHQRKWPAERIGEMLAGKPAGVAKDRCGGDQEQRATLRGGAEIDKAAGDDNEHDLEGRAFHEIEESVEEADRTEQIPRRRNHAVPCAIDADCGQQQAATDRQRSDLIVHVEQIERGEPEQRSEDCLLYT